MLAVFCRFKTDVDAIGLADGEVVKFGSERNRVTFRIIRVASTEVSGDPVGRMTRITDGGQVLALLETRTGVLLGTRSSTGNKKQRGRHDASQQKCQSTSCASGKPVDGTTPMPKSMTYTGRKGL